MKTGRSLQEIAAELERQVNTRKDYLASQGAIRAVVEPVDTTAQELPKTSLVKLDGFNGGPLAITDHAHGQLSDTLGIPKRYYDRMLAEQPELLARNINGWLQADPSTKRMVRTLDGRARAVLSSKFRPLDNFDLANAILPTLLQRNVQIMSAELTETRFYLKGILPELSEPLPEGLTWGQGHNMVGATHRDGRIVAAIVISNSDVGAGTLRVEPSMFTTWCTNLAIMAQAAMKKYHVGRSWEADANLEVFRDATRQADDAAFWMKVQDVTVAAFDPKVWGAAVAQIKAAAAAPIDVKAELPKVVEVAVAELKLPERTTGGILTALARGGDMSKWGLSSAITYVAGTDDSLDYEAATDLERAGGEVLALEGRRWDVIARAGVAA